MAVNDSVTALALNNAHFAFTNFTQSNFNSHSTAELISSPASLNDANATAISAILSNTTNGNHNNTSQRQSGRGNTFEVPMWLILCYSVILLCAVVGNLLVISTLVQNRRMRTITNVFLLNLAISDILLGVLCMPVTLVGTLLRHFIFGEFFCKLLQFSQAASVAISSWTLVAISCERYYAICHPLRSRRWQTRSHAYKIIACIWCGSMMCMLPIAMFSQLMPTNRQGLRKCRDNWPSYARPYERAYNIFLDLVLLVLPLLILSVAYFLIIRTLYVGMHIEKAMIFAGKQENTSLQRKSHSDSGLANSVFLSMCSPSTNDSSAAPRHKHNSSLRRPGGTTTKTTILCASCSSSAATNQHLRHRQQQQQHNQQLQAQKSYQQLNFQNHEQQHPAASHEEGQQQQQQKNQQHDCCEAFSRLCFRSSTNPTTGRPHLYCMRFATLKTTLSSDKKEHASSNFCTADCANSANGSTAILNTNLSNSYLTPTITKSLTSTSSLATSSTMYRYQMHHQHQNHPLQHMPTDCYCETQTAAQTKNGKKDPKKHLSKKSLRVTESVLRRNNITKNLESKKRVVKMLFVLVLEFFICWTPLYIINTVAMYIGTAIYEYIDYTSISALQLLAYSSSCCNPITYCFMNANFRRAFWHTFSGMHWCGKRFERNRGAAKSGANLHLASSVRVNSCTVQTLVIDSPRL